MPVAIFVASNRTTLVTNNITERSFMQIKLTQGAILHLRVLYSTLFTPRELQMMSIGSYDLPEEAKFEDENGFALFL